ncbi:MAG: hypothetical protein SGI72_17595 [Planctomycetota bacterium]|nr:hypothetical protein [Planctomycetota bacterium]
MKLIITRDRRKHGGALLIALIATMVCAGMAAALMSVSSSTQKEHRSTTENMQALYVAEAGLNSAIDAVRSGTPVDLGDAANPIAFSNGSYWGTSIDNGDDTFTLTVWGTSQREVRGLEAVLVQQGEDIYSSALFAGNTSGDPAYTMKFGGNGSQGDAVNGNVYSGGNILRTGSAALNGEVRATGTLSGVTGEAGVNQPVPDLAGMNYPVNNNINVAAQFASATYKNNSSYGGKAWQLPESNPAHIFRKNPNDRSANTGSTVKDDYFLEDVYEPISTSNAITPSAGAHITIAGVGGEPGSNANEMLYYIDGNLWVHNTKAFSFTLWNSSNTPIKVTFVVRGNIYISDNIFYQNAGQSGLALIAMKDSSVSDSGNIYFGDPTFGTLEYMDAFMYAENNFLDTNLSATGSARVTVHGNMTAGNQVKINRDFGSQHSKLTVNFDARIWDGDLSLPGIPRVTGGETNFLVASWREVSLP